MKWKFKLRGRKRLKNLSWPRGRAKKKSSNLARLGLVWLLAVAVLVLIAVLYRGWLKLGPKHLPSQGFYSAVVVVGRQPFWLGIEAETQKMGLVVIPKNMWVELPDGSGGYQAQALWGVDRLRQKQGEILRQGVENLLGLPVSGYLVMDDTAGNWTEGELENLEYFSLYNLVKNRVLGRGVWADGLSIWDGYLLKNKWQKARGTQKQVFWLEQLGSSLVREDKLPDGQEILRLNESAFDNKISTWFWLESVQRESAAVGVRNAGAPVGSAAKMARLLSNMGVKVVEVRNAEAEVEGAICLTARREKFPNSLAWVQKLSNCRIKVAGGEGRADIVVEIGR